MVRIGLFGLLAAPAAVLVAAVAPRALAPAMGGMWDISRSADGHNPTRLCIADPAMLAQFEHRTGSCTRVIVSDSSTSTTIHYTCAGGGFGHSQMTLITPRTIRVDTQGISGGYPFHYQIHARRVGNCTAR